MYGPELFLFMCHMGAAAAGPSMPARLAVQSYPPLLGSMVGCPVACREEHKRPQPPFLSR